MTSKAPTGTFWSTGRVQFSIDQEVSAAVNKDTEVHEWPWKEAGRIQRSVAESQSSGAMDRSGSEGSKEVRGVAENSYVAVMTWFLDKRTFKKVQEEMRPVLRESEGREIPANQWQEA